MILRPKFHQWRGNPFAHACDGLEFVAPADVQVEAIDAIDRFVFRPVRLPDLFVVDRRLIEEVDAKGDGPA
jgi:hypothetical protein